MEPVLDLLRRERGIDADAAAYRTIAQWRDWWLGRYKPFHCYREADGRGGVVRRELFSMRMAKKICEDWAAVLLGELPQLAPADAASRAFLLGEDGCSGMLERCRFWERAASLVENAFYSGTAALVLRMRGMRAGAGGEIRPGNGTRLALECVPATHLVPLSVEDGEIAEAAFCSEVLDRGRHYVYLETHTREGGRYIAANRRFSLRGGALREEALPPGVAARIDTGGALPLFAVLRPAGEEASGIGGGRGEAVFAQAIDNLKGVDLAFNNFCRDFMLGGKKVFYNRSLLCEGEGGALLAPDDICQQLFVAVGDRMPDDAQLIYEHNPALRVRDNADGVQAQLDYLSFKCGLGAKYYRFDAGNVVTATQYAGDRQELVRSAARHGLPLRRALARAAQMLLWGGRTALGLSVDPGCDIHVHLDDSVITDREAQRRLDREDVAAGLMQRHEYRMKWYAEGENDARRALGEETPTKPSTKEETR